MVRVVLPHHLRTLAQVGQEVELQVAKPVSVAAVLESLEAAYPVLKGTIREHDTHKRRAFLRFFADGEDISLEPADHSLPETIASGSQPFLIIGAIAGG
jgi:molybdopterin synthase sulfur carrier subunit